MITIDGSMGEGGGQIIRSSLALSLITGEPFTVTNIRAGRKKPGLLRQHLTAVNAAAEISRADVQGNEIGSSQMVFRPGRVKAGSYRFSVGTAGSATLVLQAVLPGLIMADGPSELTLEGGTHNPYAPPYDFLDRVFLPLLRKMGPKVTCTLERPGYYPAGGGRFRVTIEPVQNLSPIDIPERGELKKRHAQAVVCQIPENVAKRELRTVQKMLNWNEDELELRSMKEPHGPGNVLVIEMEFENLTEIFTGFGERGVPAEEVARTACKEAREYLASGAPVGRHLADQLLLPMAMAGRGSFHTMPVSMHALTNIEVIRKFMNISISCKAVDEQVWRVKIGGK
jgi:RNA 3'-terminal phosphate cyclase (ATP)